MLCARNISSGNGSLSSARTSSRVQSWRTLAPGHGIEDAGKTAVRDMRQRSEGYGLQFRLAVVQAEAVRTISVLRSEKCYMCQSVAFPWRPSRQVRKPAL